MQLCRFVWIGPLRSAKFEELFSEDTLRAADRITSHVLRDREDIEVCRAGVRFEKCGCMKVAGGEVIASLIHACNGITDPRDYLYDLTMAVT